MREKAEKPAKRKLTRAERKQIEAVIRQAKGDGKAHTVQDSIPFQNMFPDGLCRLEGGAFSKTIAFEDVNYRLAGPEDQRSIFESLCDFYNGYDPSIGVQVSLDSRSGGSAADEMFGIRRQGNDLDPIRDEAVDILRMQYKRGNNGYVKTKYVTLTIEAENLPAARARFARIETDTLNRFKVMGAAAHVLDGKERLELLYNILHPEGGQFAFEWDWLPASGLSVKDFISPSSFHFGETRTFRIGKRYGAVSFLQILAPEINTHCKGALKRGALTEGGVQELTFIPEGDVYRLIVHSRLPGAERFEKWVFDEVLPMIRKTGGYMTASLLGQAAEKPEILLAFADQLLAEHEKNRQLSGEVERLRPKADFYDAFVHEENCTNIRATAKELQIGERAFCRFLMDAGFLYRCPAGYLLPYAKPSNNGLFRVKDFWKYGHFGQQTLITPQGKNVIRLLLDDGQMRLEWKERMG